MKSFIQGGSLDRVAIGALGSLIASYFLDDMMRHRVMAATNGSPLLPGIVLAALLPFATLTASPRAFLEQHCYDCHDQETQKGGVDFTELTEDLSAAQVFQRWERIHDRLAANEMPPPDKAQPAREDKSAFLAELSEKLSVTHQKQKGTVLRRLNRSEFENTMNDMFGTTLKLAELLPNDGRLGEFDNVGETLSVSMVQMKRYLEAADLVLDNAIAKTVEPPELKTINASYKGPREGEKWIGKVWKELADGAVVRFNDGGYPTGMMRSSNVRERGRYRVRVTGYAYQSDQPVTALIGGTSFARGSPRPVYTYHTFNPGKAQTVEFETIIDRNYMILIEPYGLFMKQHQREEIDSHTGPGLAIRSVEITGPLADSFPSPGHRLLFDGIERAEVQPRNPKDKLKSWYRPKFEVLGEPNISHALQRLASRAFRRPVSQTTIAPYLELFQSEREDGATTEDALLTASAAILCAPEFLYLKELPGPLDDHALASRLSYFLTRSLPDTALLEDAGQGTVTSKLPSHVERLLKSKHADRFITDFTDAWLDLREIDFTNPDEKLFPEFDDYLKWSMVEETRAFFRHLIEANLPITNLIKSDFAFLNERLAKHYQIPGIEGAHLRKVPLKPDSPRGGVLSQAAVLKVTANGNNTSPVVRGVWVLERLLGIHPQPPPPGISGVEPDVRGASTLRELLEKHRDSTSCQACHRLIDPPGFALESFNPIGGWRDRFRSLGKGEKVNLQINNRRVRYMLGREVDAAGQLPNGQQFKGYLEFRDHLASDADTLAETLATKLLTFGTGREMGFSDRSAIESIVEASKNKGHGVRDLIHLVTENTLFRSK